MNSLGESFGYIMTSIQLQNPLDHLLIFLRSLFPLDYTVILIFTTFTFYSAITGIQNVGLGIPWIKVPFHFSSLFSFLFLYNLHWVLLDLDLQNRSVEHAHSIDSSYDHDISCNSFHSRCCFLCSSATILDLLFTNLCFLFQLLKHVSIVTCPSPRFDC